MAICIKNKTERRTSSVEDKKTNMLLEQCETIGISKTIIHLFIHLQEQKHEQDNKEA